jgi:hypothetical protein
VLEKPICKIRIPYTAAINKNKNVEEENIIGPVLTFFSDHIKTSLKPSFNRKG